MYTSLDLDPNLDLDQVSMTPTSSHLQSMKSMWNSILEKTPLKWLRQYANIENTDQYKCYHGNKLLP